LAGLWPAAADVPAYAAADRILPVRYEGEVLGALSRISWRTCVADRLSDQTRACLV
jgi:hypothetical protein